MPHNANASNLDKRCTDQKTTENSFLDYFVLGKQTAETCFENLLPNGCRWKPKMEISCRYCWGRSTKSKSRCLAFKAFYGMPWELVCDAISTSGKISIYSQMTTVLRASIWSENDNFKGWCPTNQLPRWQPNLSAISMTVTKSIDYYHAYVCLAIRKWQISAKILMEERVVLMSSNWPFLMKSYCPVKQMISTTQLFNMEHCYADEQRSRFQQSTECTFHKELYKMTPTRPPEQNRNVFNWLLIRKVDEFVKPKRANRKKDFSFTRLNEKGK